MPRRLTRLFPVLSLAGAVALPMTAQIALSQSQTDMSPSIITAAQLESAGYDGGDLPSGRSALTATPS